MLMAFPFLAYRPFIAPLNLTGLRGSCKPMARDLKPPVLHRAAELFRDVHTVRQVADLLGVSRSEAGRLRVRAAADGILGAVREDYLEAAVEGCSVQLGMYQSPEQ
jgi:hypothetical protein